ncbi:hypothetical protein JXA12_02530 [Candidatus Woesearchaeota archaeon]|nr:hypothetical protein [Candidatus Woesearchaeota archaeon]
MRNKKGIEIALNTVIIAVLALLVLAVVIFIIIKNVGPVNPKLLCPQAGGSCRLANECPPGYDIQGNVAVDGVANKGCPSGQVCCELTAPTQPVT